MLLLRLPSKLAQTMRLLLGRMSVDDLMMVLLLLLQMRRDSELIEMLLQTCI